MSRLSPSQIEARFLGSILGLAVGDATGAPFEGMPATAIHYDFGGARRAIERPVLDLLAYTDDTQMTIGVLETLIDCGEIDVDTLVTRFAANYHPDRGYGQGARRILEAMASGGDWRSIARTIFPGGSLGNGAAMRVAPVGLLFHEDLDRVADEATKSALPTHQHLVGVDGARILALAVALAVQSDGPFDRIKFFDVLIRYAATEEFRSQLERAAALSPRDSVEHLGHSLEAHRSVVTAIACFAFDPDDYATVIARAIDLGDDADTLAAMAGACAGARLGLAAVPPQLISRLEDGPQGRSYLMELARRLAARFQQQHP